MGALQSNPCFDNRDFKNTNLFSSLNNGGKTQGLAIRLFRPGYQKICTLGLANYLKINELKFWRKKYYIGNEGVNSSDGRDHILRFLKIVREA